MYVKEKIRKYIEVERLKCSNVNVFVNYNLSDYENCLMYTKKYLYLFKGKLELDELANEFYLHCMERSNNGRFKSCASLTTMFQKIYLKYFDITELKDIIRYDDLCDYYIEYTKEECNIDDVIDDICKQQMTNNLNKVLIPREVNILKSKYGFNNGEIKTYEEVGKEFQITSERVRQIEAKALRKLRHPSRLNMIQ